MNDEDAFRETIKDSHPIIYEYNLLTGKVQYNDSKLKYEYYKDEEDPFGQERKEVLDELIRLEDEKIGFLRKENNLREYLQELIVNKLKNYMNNNFVYSTSIGMQGIGKSTFFSDNFEKESIDADKELNNGNFVEFADEIWAYKRFNRLIEHRIECKKSTLLDGLSHTIKRRKDLKRTKNENNADIFLFFFQGNVKTCLERIIKRNADTNKGTKPLAEVVNYLVQLEMPINKSYELEEGIDL